MIGRRSLLSLVALAGGLGLAGCVKDGDEHASGATGKAMFGQYCAGCHGDDGAGNFLAGVPANRATDLSVAQIADRLLEAGPKHQRMPAFPKLSRGEALVIAGHVDALRRESGGQGVFWDTSAGGSNDP